MTRARNPEQALSSGERDRYIVERLRSAGGPVSGEALAAELGMSRVALWKRVESLKAWGYGIEASRKGYELVRDDGLAGWELGAPGPVLLFDTVGSTMDEAAAMARDGAPSGTTVLALAQTAGRGRQGGAWASPSGGLYLSVVLRSALPPSHAGALSLEAAAATIRALEEAGATGLSYRWPSDILWGAGKESEPRKAGGILVEAHGDIAAADCYIVGIGLSVAPLEMAGRGAATDGRGAVAARRAALAATIVRSIVAWSDAPSLAPARWDRLRPASDRALDLDVWNGTKRRIVPSGFDARGDLVPADGGPAVSIGECRHIYKEGES